MVCMLRIVVVFVLVEISIAAVFNGSFLDTLDNEIGSPNALKTRRQNGKKNDRSTSSSSGAKKSQNGKGSGAATSLELSDASSSSSSGDSKKVKKPKKKDRTPKSSRERKGWRKWHRKCTPCPEDMQMKWRQPTIKWICGAYQSARRTFKSLCMMHYRNCQDGTMFTKISDHRCQNSTDLYNHGKHFFYDYKVKLSDSDSKSDSKSKSSQSSSSDPTDSSDSASISSSKQEEMGNDVEGT